MKQVLIIWYFQTVFEIGQSSHLESYKVMKTKRVKDNEIIRKFKEKGNQEHFVPEGKIFS